MSFRLLLHKWQQKKQTSHGPSGLSFLNSVHPFVAPSHNHVLQTASPQMVAEEANLPWPFRTILSQLRSSFCSSLHSYRERIGLIPSIAPSALSVELNPMPTSIFLFYLGAFFHFLFLFGCFFHFLFLFGCFFQTYSTFFRLIVLFSDLRMYLLTSFKTTVV